MKELIKVNNGKKHLNNKRNLFKVVIDIVLASLFLTLNCFTHCSVVSIVNFEQVNPFHNFLKSAHIAFTFDMHSIWLFCELLIHPNFYHRFL